MSWALIWQVPLGFLCAALVVWMVVTFAMLVGAAFAVIVTGWAGIARWVWGKSGF